MSAVETKVKDAGFGRRMDQAADMHPHCPAKFAGRGPWLVQEMQRRGHRVSTETVSKWFEGESLPKPDKREALAEALGVDTAWLILGVDAALAPKERKLRNAQADGVVNVVAGIIQMDGGHPAFPDEADKRASKEQIDLYAVIRGANYSLNIALGEAEDRFRKFVVTSSLGENVIVIGAVKVGTGFELYELTPEVLETGQRRGGSIEVVAPTAKLKLITGFSDRL